MSIRRNTGTKRFIFDEVMSSRTSVMDENGDWVLMPTIPSSPSDGSSVQFDEFGRPLPSNSDLNADEFDNDPPMLQDNNKGHDDDSSDGDESPPQGQKRLTLYSSPSESSDEEERMNEMRHGFKGLGSLNSLPLSMSTLDTIEEDLEEKDEQQDHHKKKQNIKEEKDPSPKNNNATSTVEENDDEDELLKDAVPTVKQKKIKTKKKSTITKDKVKKKRTKPAKTGISNDASSDNNDQGQQQQMSTTKNDSLNDADGQGQQQQQNQPVVAEPILTFDTDSTTASGAIRKDAYRKSRRNNLRQRIKSTKRLTRTKKKSLKQKKLEYYNSPKKKATTAEQDRVSPTNPPSMIDIAGGEQHHRQRKYKKASTDFMGLWKNQDDQIQQLQKQLLEAHKTIQTNSHQIQQLHKQVMSISEHSIKNDPSPIVLSPARKSPREKSRSNSLSSPFAHTKPNGSKLHDSGDTFDTKNSLIWSTDDGDSKSFELHRARLEHENQHAQQSAQIPKEIASPPPPQQRQNQENQNHLLPIEDWSDVESFGEDENNDDDCDGGKDGSVEGKYAIPTRSMSSSEDDGLDRYALPDNEDNSADDTDKIENKSEDRELNWSASRNDDNSSCGEGGIDDDQVVSQRVDINADGSGDGGTHDKDDDSLEEYRNLSSLLPDPSEDHEDDDLLFGVSGSSPTSTSKKNLDTRVSSPVRQNEEEGKSHLLYSSPQKSVPTNEEHQHYSPVSRSLHAIGSEDGFFEEHDPSTSSPKRKHTAEDYDGSQPEEYHHYSPLSRSLQAIASGESACDEENGTTRSETSPSQAVPLPVPSTKDSSSISGQTNENEKQNPCSPGSTSLQAIATYDDDEVDDKGYDRVNNEKSTSPEEHLQQRETQQEHDASNRSHNIKGSSSLEGVSINSDDCLEFDKSDRLAGGSDDNEEDGDPLSRIEEEYEERLSGDEEQPASNINLIDLPSSLRTAASEDTLSQDSVSLVSDTRHASNSTDMDGKSTGDELSMENSEESVQNRSDDLDHYHTYEQPLTPTTQQRRLQNSEIFEETKHIIEEMEKVIGGQTKKKQQQSIPKDALASSATSPSLSIPTDETLRNSDKEIVEVFDKSMTDHFGDFGIYSGLVLKSTGAPHGAGTMMYEDYERKYTGEWHDGRWHGEGYAHFANGDRYRGSFEHDVRNGKGIYFYRDGRVYEGSFKNDLRSGVGELRWPNGALYNGEWRRGKRDGYGKYVFPDDAGVYVGEWKDGLYHGHGVCEWDNGRRYAGEWRYGKANGQGKETDPQGQTYFEGEWKDDAPLD